MNNLNPSLDDVVWLLKQNIQVTFANITWPKEYSQQREVFQRILQLLSDDDSRLKLCISLLKHQLRNSRAIEINEFGDVQIWEKMFAGYDIARVQQMSWVVFPVLVYRNHTNKNTNNGEKLEFLLGAQQHGSGKLGCAAKCLASDSLQFANDACTAISRYLPAIFDYDYCLIPLEKNYSQVEEGSLGLPLVLALARLHGEPVNPAVYATGAVKPDGKITAVAGVELKQECAQENGAKLFLIPKECDTLHSKFAVAVETIAEALMWAQLYTDDNYADLQRLTLAQHSPVEFVAQLPTLQIESIKWLLSNYKELLDGVLSNKETRMEFINAISKMYGNNWHSCAAIFSFIEDKTILAIQITDCNFACMFFSIATGIANHTGKPDQANIYYQYIKDDLETWYKNYPKDCSDYINRKFIAERHNCYHFSAEIPPDFNAILSGAVKYHRALIDRPLAALYGTLAQNYAFCALYDKAFELLDKQRECLNDTNNPKIYKDYLRAFSYEVYIHLDRSHYVQAQRALLTYLQIDSLDNLDKQQILGENWSLYPLLRYAADCGITQNHTINELCDTLAMEDKLITSNPQQLILYNAGRVLQQCDNLSSATKCWRKSLQWCVAQDYTILHMALLPATALWQAKALNATDRQQVDTLLINMNTINYPHFNGVLQTTGAEAALEYTAANIKTLFPFHYR